MVVGHGAREHCIVRRLVDEGCETVSVYRKPNAGLEHTAGQKFQVKSYQPKDIARIATRQRVDIVFPGTEEALFAGIVDTCRVLGIPCVGPTQAACDLEADRRIAIDSLSKHFPKHLANSVVIHTEAHLASIAAHRGKRHGAGVVVKRVHNVNGHFVKHINLSSVSDRSALVAHLPVVLEDFTPGDNFSLYYLLGRSWYYYLMSVVDYPYLTQAKHVLTGGMGAVSFGASPWLVSKRDLSACQSICGKLLDDIFQHETRRYSGVFVAQFRKSGRRLLLSEIEVKPGDPEFINILLSMATPFKSCLTAMVDGAQPEIKLHKQAVVTVCHAPRTYAGTVGQSGGTIPCNIVDHPYIFIGETRRTQYGLETGASRTLSVVGAGRSVETARLAAYRVSKDINLGLYYRPDIGHDISIKARTRVAASAAALRATGGGRKTFSLSPAAIRALYTLRQRPDAPDTDSELIDRLLRRAAHQH